LYKGSTVAYALLIPSTSPTTYPLKTQSLWSSCQPSCFALVWPRSLSPRRRAHSWRYGNPSLPCPRPRSPCINLTVGTRVLLTVHLRALWLGIAEVRQCFGPSTLAPSLTALTTRSSTVKCSANSGFVPIASGGDGAIIQHWYVGWDASLQVGFVFHLIFGVLGW
jgi:hypothetical protein